MEKTPVSANFVAALSKMFPDAPHGSYLIEDHGDGVGPVLAYWGLDAPIPTDAEIEAALLIPDKVDNITDLKADIAALTARLAALEAK